MLNDTVLAVNVRGYDRDTLIQIKDHIPIR